MPKKNVRLSQLQKLVQCVEEGYQAMERWYLRHRRDSKEWSADWRDVLTVSGCFEYARLHVKHLLEEEHERLWLQRNHPESEDPCSMNETIPSAVSALSADGTHGPIAPAGAIGCGLTEATSVPGASTGSKQSDLFTSAEASTSA